MADKQEIRKRIAHLSIGKRNGETLSTYSIAQDYFKGFTVAQYDALHKKEWDRVYNYASELFRTMRKKGVWDVSEERDRGEGKLKEKIYTLTQPARAYFEKVTRGEIIE